MEFYNSIEKTIDELKKNQYGIIVKKTQKNMIITTSIKFPKDILKKEISEMSIEFLLIIDLYKPKFFPKLYCISPYCYPHFADGRDIFNELPSSKNPKRAFNFRNILSEILEFIKANFKKGGLYFFGKHYLGGRYDLRMLKKGCDIKNIFNVKESLVLNGKNIKLNRLVILSDVYFLMFEQEKWYKNNLILIFWSSISNIQKIQKVKDNKMLILHWSQKDKENFYMSLTLNQKDNFINILLDKMHQFGMAYDIKKMDEIREKESISTNKKNKDDENENKKITNDNKKEDGEDEDEYEEEEEEEDDDNEEEEKNNNDKNQNKEIKAKKEGEINEDNKQNFKKGHEEKEQNENGENIENKVKNEHEVNENIKDENNIQKKEIDEKKEESNEEEVKKEDHNKIEEKKEEVNKEEITENKNLDKTEEKKERIKEKNIENIDKEAGNKI